MFFAIFADGPMGLAVETPTAISRLQSQPT